MDGKEGEKGTSCFLSNTLSGVNSLPCLFDSGLSFSLGQVKCLRLVTATTCRRCSRTEILFESRGISSLQDRLKTICFGLETFQNRALTGLPSQNSEQRY